MARDDRRLISVVLDSPSERTRTAASKALMSYGMRFFETHRLYAAGEEWTARSDRGPLERGTAVRVTGNDGMVLMVEPMTAVSESTEGTA